MKKRNWLVLGLLISLIIPFAVAKASEFKTDGIITITKDEIVSGSLYATGSEVTIDGNITGDLVVIAEKVIINGELGGDLIAIASTIEINGIVGGNLRVITPEIKIKGEIKRNATIASNKITFEKESLLHWDLMSISEEITMNGKILGRADILSGNIGLGGIIEKDLSIKLEGEEETLIISPESEIKGNLSYTKDKNSFINNQGKIGGETNFSEKESKSDFNFWSFASERTMAILAALLAAIALSYGLKKHTAGIVAAINKDPLKSFLYGLIVLIATPIALLIIAITIIGLPLALSLAAIYVAALYLTKVLSAIFIGNLIFKKIIKKDSNKFLVILSGIVICWLLFSIPYVGTILALTASSLGLGAILKYVRD